MEPFWRIYKQHLDPAVDIQQILAPMRIGTLHEDFAEKTSIQREKKEDDPYKDEPSDIPLFVYAAEPCNAGAGRVLGDPYITPWSVVRAEPPPRST